MSLLPYQTRTEMTFSSFDHLASYQVKQPTLSMLIKEHCLTAFTDICAIENGLTWNSELNSLIERTNKIVTFSGQASDCISTRLYKHQYFLKEASPSNTPEEISIIENANFQVMEESAQLAQLVHSITSLNTKLDQVIDRILQKDPSAKIIRPKSHSTIMDAVPDKFKRQLSYIPPQLYLITTTMRTLPTVQTTTTEPLQNALAKSQERYDAAVERLNDAAETSMNRLNDIAEASIARLDAQIKAVENTQPVTETTTKSEPVKFSTLIEVECDVGFGNDLRIRGIGAGLSWDEGTKMTYENGKWCYLIESDEAVNCAFKFLVNDTEWEELEGDHQLEIGSAPTHTLTIKMPVAQ